ncbi:MAG: DUF4230 domain-containing protein [Phycisphaerales bacterium]|nr:DUF4230 domain-containing protein [Phycisphaerales bacterium]
MSNRLTILGCVAIVCVCALIAYSIHTASAVFGPAPVVIQTTPSVTSVKRLAQLATLRVAVRAIVTVEQDGYLGYWLGSSKLIYDARGDAVIGVDLSTIEISEMDDAAKTATVTLRKPRVQSHRVILERSDFLIEDQSYFVSESARQTMRRQAQRQAEPEIKREAEQEELLKTAQEQAESVLQEFYAPLGWRLRFKWVP